MIARIATAGSRPLPRTLLRTEAISESQVSTVVATPSRTASSDSHSKLTIVDGRMRVFPLVWLEPLGSASPRAPQSGSNRAEIQADVGGGGRLGDSPDRDVGDSRLRLGSNRLQGDSAARLRGHAPRDPAHRLAQHRRVHVVQENVDGAGGERRFDLVE